MKLCDIRLTMEDNQCFRFFLSPLTEIPHHFAFVRHIHLKFLRVMITNHKLNSIIERYNQTYSTIRLYNNAKDEEIS